VKYEAQIANAVQAERRAHGVAVVAGVKGCMTSRGVQKSQATLLTIRMLGRIGEQAQTRQEFLSAINLAGVARPGNLFL